MKELDELEARIDAGLAARRERQEYDRKWVHMLHWAIRDKVGEEGWREILATATRMADDPNITPKYKETETHVG